MKTVRIAGGTCVIAFVLLPTLARPCASQNVAVDPRPALTLVGTAPDGAPVFGLVAGAVRLADGTIVVGDASSSSLKFFDRRGRLARTAGRHGQGPGEFQLLRRLMQCGPDSVFALDAFGGRVSVFSASSRFVRQSTLPRGASVVACSRNGVLALLKADPAVRPEATAVQRLSATLQLADASGAGTRDLGSVTAGEIVASGNGWLPRPGGPDVSIAVGRNRAVACPSDSGAVAAYGLNGVRLPSIPLPGPSRAPSRRFLERSAETVTSAMPAGAFRDSLRQRLMRLPPPATMPPCSKILIDPSGDVWVVLSQPGDSVTSIAVFGDDDHRVGSLTLPAEMEVLEVGLDYLLSSGETGGGEPWVRMYRVRRTPAH